MKDFFDRLDKATNEKNRLESERERIGQLHYRQAEIFAGKLAELLKPYIAEFEERDYRCDQKLNGPYYSLRVASRQRNAELAIVNSRTNEVGFELAGYDNDSRIYLNSPNIGAGFDKRKIEELVQSVFANLFE